MNSRNVGDPSRLVRIAWRPRSHSFRGAIAASTLGTAAEKMAVITARGYKCRSVRYLAVNPWWVRLAPYSCGSRTLDDLDLESNVLRCVLLACAPEPLGAPCTAAEAIPSPSLGSAL